MLNLHFDHGAIKNETTTNLSEEISKLINAYTKAIEGRK